MSLPDRGISGDQSLLMYDSFDYTTGVKAWDPTKWATGLTPLGSSLGCAVTGYGKMTTANAGSYQMSASVSARAAINKIADVELYCEWRFPDSREVIPRWILRAVESSINATSGYYVKVTRAGTVTVGAEGGDSDTYSIGSLSTNTLYTIRMRIQGSTLSVKIWPTTSAANQGEPSSWQYSSKWTDWPAAGYCGVMAGVGKTVQPAALDLASMRLFSVGNPIPAAPVIDAGNPVSAQIGSVFSRRATVLSSAGNLTWSWSMVSKPSGSNATLTGGAPTVSFTPDVVGSYTLKATATDSYGQSGSDTFVFTAVAKSTLGGRLCMLDDGQLHAARHRAYLAAGRWSS